MHPEHLTAEQVARPTPRPEPGRSRGDTRRASSRPRIILVALALAAAGSGGAYLLASGRSQKAKQAEASQQAASGPSSAGEPTVQVVKPERGGMERTTNQPGTVRAFEYAELFTKVSGFVKTLSVDRGSRVKKDQLLAEIYDPERDVAVETGPGRARALACRPSRRPTQASSPRRLRYWPRRPSRMRPRLYANKSCSERDYRKKQYIRIVDLVKKGDVEERLADEEHDNYLSAEGAVHSAEAGIETAAAEFAEATAAVEKARADLKAAEAGVNVSEGQPRHGQGLRAVHQNPLTI